MKKALLAVNLCAIAFCSIAWAQTAAPSLTNPASMKATAPATYTAKFKTTKGDFEVHVTRAWAPIGADRFYNLVRSGFFTDAAFFRVIKGFMVQFGINAKPEVAKVWAEARIKDDPVTKSNTRGMITFATSGPNARTTQVFINFGNNAQLDSQSFAPFGEVTGMDIVDMLYNGYGENPPEVQTMLTNQGKAYVDKSWPKMDRILSATIEPAAAAPAKEKEKAKAK